MTYLFDPVTATYWHWLEEQATYACLDPSLDALERARVCAWACELEQGNREVDSVYERDYYRDLWRNPPFEQPPRYYPKHVQERIF